MRKITSDADAKKGYYKINWLERIAFGSGDMSQNFIYQTVTTYLLFFYTNVYELDPKIAATMFLLIRIIDAVWDPFVGSFIDRFTLPFGKYRGWMLIMGAPLSILMILCFVVPPLAGTSKVIYACATYVGLSVFYTTVNVPFGALNAALTRDPRETTVLVATRMWLVNVAQLLVTYGLPNLIIYFSLTDTNNTPGDAHAWLSTIAIFGCAGLLLLIFSYCNTKERVFMPKEDSENIRATEIFKEFIRNKHLRIISFMFITGFAIMAITNSASSYFVTYNMGNSSGSLIGTYNVISAIPPLLILPFTPKLRDLLGKKRLLYIALSVAICGFMGLFFVPANNYTLVFIFQFIRSSGFGFTGAFIWSTIPEAVTYGEWKTGKRTSGIANALIGFFLKFGLALGGFVPGIVLWLSGFSLPTSVTEAGPLIPQPDSALFGIRLVLAGIPALLCVLLIFIVSKYSLTDEKLEKMNYEIEERKRKNNAK
ncbi:MAG: MFS transporter [Bifidobacteriaceae bacterium]|jgi:GPH family glycoside/pentoside/hexuronide:cation symporter|nr:MFS transporter [Bifidobacteriaceae bacterium]